MQINGIDVTTYGFKYLRRDISPATYAIYGSEWLKNAHSPLLGDRRIRYSQITLTLLYPGTNQAYETMKSVLLDRIKESTITFGDLEFYFAVSLDSALTLKYKNLNFRELTVVLNAYAKYKPEIVEVANRVPSKTINVPGELDTPAIVEITPSVDLVDLTISGLGEPFTISALTAGQTIIVSGEDCTITQGGVNKYPDFEGWGFPLLQPSSNLLTFSRTNADITIRYKPRWL